MSTTKSKDILGDATSVPTTAPDKENEDKDVDENKIIFIEVNDDTIDNSGSFRYYSFKDSNIV